MRIPKSYKRVGAMIKSFTMKKSGLKMEKFLELKLNSEAMNKIRGGDSPIDPFEPPVLPPPK
jgi:hypothetical protein